MHLTSKIKTLFHSRLLLPALLLVFLLAGCNEDPVELPRDINQRDLPDHSVLVYIVSENNLDYYGDDSFDAITEAYYNAGNRRDANLFVFIDNVDNPPILYWLDPEYGLTELVRYPEGNSVSPDNLRQVCATAFSSGKRQNPVNTAIFWSHGTSWWPVPKTESRSFGDDDGFKIDITDMADALRGLSIQNLMFDACLMAGVEVAAEFADVADVLVASPTEILATSYPYYSIIPALCTSTPDMHKVVDLYYDHYQGMTNGGQSGILTTVELKQIRQLAQAFGKLQQAGHGDDHILDISALCYDREAIHLAYDIVGYAQMHRDKAAESIGSEAAGRLYDDFITAFYDCNIYCKHTDRFISINLSGASGLSVFIPGKYNLTSYEEFYRTLAWYQWSHANE